MKYIISFFLFFLVCSILGNVGADNVCTPPDGGKCINKEQLEEIRKGLTELDKIHKSPAVVTTTESIVIIHDWDGRVYTNGGDNKPMHFKLKLGDTVDRDMSIVLPTQIYYRLKPPDPMFRLRIRAQLGALIPELVRTSTGTKQNFLDAGIGWDFFHLGPFNLSAYTGVASSGGGIGFDITKNFGPYVGYSLVYDGWRSSVQTGLYFSFN